MLGTLGSVKVLIGKHDPRDYRGAGVKRTMVTAIECMSADGSSWLPMIIWPATTHHSNWTTYLTSEWHYAHSETGYNDFKISLEWMEHFNSRYSSVRERALISRNVEAAWAANGLFPFDPDGVLKDTPKSVSLTVFKAYELDVGSCL